MATKKSTKEVQAVATLEGFASKIIRGKDELPDVRQVRITVAVNADDVNLDILKTLQGEVLGFRLWKGQLEVGD